MSWLSYLADAPNMEVVAPRENAGLRWISHAPATKLGPPWQPPWKVLCADCGEPKTWMLLLRWSNADELDWFDYCQNQRCNQGPTIIRELVDPYPEQP